LTLTGGDSPSAMDYAALIDRIRERPDFALLQTVLLRSLSRAEYSPDNVGHFGLAYDAYAHFTSPIRRYPDLLVHRAIKAVLAGKRYSPSGATWAELGVHCSMTERRADDASRDVLQWLKCHYMKEKVGETFAGTISGVASFGIFVTLDGLDIDGLVHVTELPRDYFHFDAVRHALIGERSGRTYQLAGRVMVKVARVDLERAKIDFTLDETARPADLPSLGPARSLSLEAAPPSSPRPSVREALARSDRPRGRKGRRST
jgi:ribonuclease R